MSQANEDDAFAKDMMMKKRSRIKPLLDLDAELACDDLDPITKPKKSKAKKSPIDQDDEPLLDDSKDVPLIMKRSKKVFPTTFAEVKVRAFFCFDILTFLDVFPLLFRIARHVAPMLEDK